MSNKEQRDTAYFLLQKNAATIVKLWMLSKISTNHHCIPAGQKILVPHIIKKTFATEKLYLNSTGEKSQFISVIFVKDLIQYVSSIVEDLEKTRSYGLKVLMKISGFCSQTTKGGST